MTSACTLEDNDPRSLLNCAFKGDMIRASAMCRAKERHLGEVVLQDLRDLLGGQGGGEGVVQHVLQLVVGVVHQVQRALHQPGGRLNKGRLLPARHPHVRGAERRSHAL